jgi:hypothetical protein
MRGIEPVKTARYAVLALVAVMGGVIVLALPPAPRPLAPMTSIAPAVRGAFHIHTVRSDGTGTMEDVAAAAARAGLAFIIVTDHGDAMREPDSPAYRSGVLCIDAVEISTSGGHVVALGLPASSYPLAGEPRDVVADIHRLGGMAVAAHPGSAKPALQWVDWSAPVDGLEWLNADSEWRDEGTFALARALLTYPLRRTATLGALLDRPASVLGRWDDLLSRHRVVGLAAADAHARLALEDDARTARAVVRADVPRVLHRASWRVDDGRCGHRRLGCYRGDSRWPRFLGHRCDRHTRIRRVRGDGRHRVGDAGRLAARGNAGDVHGRDQRAREC